MMLGGTKRSPPPENLVCVLLQMVGDGARLFQTQKRRF